MLLIFEIKIIHIFQIYRFMRRTLQNYEEAFQYIQIQDSEEHSSSSVRLSKPPIFSKLSKNLHILKHDIVDGEYECSPYQGRHLIKYTNMENGEDKCVSENHLRSRKQKFLREMSEEQAEGEEQVQREEMNTMEGQRVVAETECDNNKNKKQKQKQKIGRCRQLWRYYNMSLNQTVSPKTISTVKCYKCGQQGHIAKNCFDTSKNQHKCQFCLGDHYQSHCLETKFCQKCQVIGHDADECSGRGNRCDTCGRKGHQTYLCGNLMISETNERMTAKYNQGDIELLRCLNKCQNDRGHYNCFRYEKRPPRIYD